MCITVYNKYYTNSNSDAVDYFTMDTIFLINLSFAIWNSKIILCGCGFMTNLGGKVIQQLFKEKNSKKPFCHFGFPIYLSYISYVVQNFLCNIFSLRSRKNDQII